MFELTPNAAKSKWTETVLNSFGCSGGECPDGGYPWAGLITDAAGRLYGTTRSGGIYSGGTVFEVIHNAAKTKWTEAVLHSFGAGTDGSNPEASLIADAAGRLYGTTNAGGTHVLGTVFELSPNAAKTKWTETLLHSFSGSDGENPSADLIMDAAGRLYGTTYGGGAHVSGTVFAVTPNAAKTKWAETVLYSFCARGGGLCTDGGRSYAGLIMDAAGHLYGTTVDFGVYGRGTGFELASNAARTQWTETILHNFCVRIASEESCADGEDAYGGLIMDPSGHLYGTTAYGGAHPVSGDGAGTVFELP